VCRAFGKLGYDAIGVGEKDLSLGVGYLRTKGQEYGLPLLSTNAVDRTTGEPLFPPTLVKEKGGIRVGFLSVISPERHIVAQVESDLLAANVELLDPATAVRKYLPELRQKADVVVLLSHCGIETSRFLAEDLDVDVVIVGHFPAIQEDPEKIGNTIFAQAGSMSDRFGTLGMTLGKDGKIAEFEGDAIRVLQKGPTNGELAALETAWDEAVDALRKDAQLAHQREQEAIMRNQTTKEVAHRNGVFGAESCRSCHEPVYQSWMNTPHANAFARLAEADAWDNPECIGCHVTGVQEKHYVSDVNVPPETWNVQCEECHGSGVNHARDGTYLGAGEATCIKCHDPQNSPEFDYAVYQTYGVH
jgi:hypothetical protein